MTHPCLIALAGCLLSFQLIASEPNADRDELSVEEDQEEQHDTKTEIHPDANNSKSRDLGEAFKNFRPSEEISADNAVPFPVDI